MEAKLNEADKKVAKAIDGNGGKGDDNLITLSTGVVLRAKQASPGILIRVMTKNQRPRPPMYFNTSMGREMENPDHPDYLDQVKAWEMEYKNGILNALIGLGTELVSVPKKFPRPEDDSWIEDYRFFGLPVIPQSKSWRYTTWILFLAGPLDTDTNLIGEKVRELSGTKEADVRDAETFPDGDEAQR